MGLLGVRVREFRTRASSSMEGSALFAPAIAGSAEYEDQYLRSMRSEELSWRQSTGYGMPMWKTSGKGESTGHDRSMIACS